MNSLKTIFTEARKGHEVLLRFLGCLLCLTIPVSFTGCSTAGMGKLARELKNDPAIVAVKAVTPWGNASLVRVGGQTNSVSVSPDGTVTINPQFK